MTFGLCSSWLFGSRGFSLLSFHHPHSPRLLPLFHAREKGVCCPAVHPLGGWVKLHRLNHIQLSAILGRNEGEKERRNRGRGRKRREGRGERGVEREGEEGREKRGEGREGEEREGEGRKGEGRKGKKKGRGR